MIRRYGGLLFLILFPIVGFIGMILILSGGRNENNPETTNSNSHPFPSPLPILTTRVPTATPNVILDEPVPAATLVTMDGEEFTLADYQGTIVVLNFWATWCTPCVEEMPFLRDYAASHDDIQVIASTAPNIGQSPDMITGFITTYELEDLTIALDENGYLQGTMGALQLPTTFIIDADGIVRFRHIGMVDAEALDYYLGELE